MNTLEILLAADKVGRDGARNLCRADLTWAAHVVANDIDVTAYFTELAKDKTVVLQRGVATWKSQTSYAKAVLAHYSPTNDAAEAFRAIESDNRGRKRDGKREVWSVQTIAKTLAKAAKADDTEPEAQDTEAEATEAETTTESPLTVILSLLPHLDASDLTAVADAVAALRTVKAA